MIIKFKLTIKEKLLKEYKLEIHEAKTIITKCNNCFSFLGYTFKIINNKTIIKIKRSNREKIKKKLKEIKYKLNNNLTSYAKAFSTVMTYENIFHHCDNQKMHNLIERYFYNAK